MCCEPQHKEGGEDVAELLMLQLAWFPNVAYSSFEVLKVKVHVLQRFGPSYWYIIYGPTHTAIFGANTDIRELQIFNIQYIGQFNISWMWIIKYLSQRKVIDVDMWRQLWDDGAYKKKKHFATQN